MQARPKKIRIGASLLLIDGYCFQSFMAERLSYLGPLDLCVDHLVNFGCDEICVSIPYHYGEEAALKSFETISDKHIPVPLTLNGAISTLMGSRYLSQGVFERFAINSQVFTGGKIAADLRKRFGRQSLIANLPFKKNGNRVEFLDFSAQKSYDIDEVLGIDFSDYDELILHDLESHGHMSQFPYEVIESVMPLGKPLVLLGGVSANAVRGLAQFDVVGCLIDNLGLYGDQEFRNASRR